MDDDKTSQYVALPPITVSYDMGLETIPEDNVYPYRVRYEHTNPELLENIKNLDNNMVKYCTSNSKKIWGSKKSEKVVSASVSKGKLEKLYN